MKLESAQKYLLFDDRLFRLIGTPIIGLLIAAVFGINWQEDTWQEMLQDALFSIFHTFLYWQSTRWLIIQMRKRFHENQQTFLRVLVQIAILPFLILALASLIYFIDIQMNGENIEGFSTVLLVSSIATIIMVSVYESIYFFRLWTQSLLAQKELEKEAVQSQMNLLQSQVNPHFLFNSLNTLTAIIPENTDLAIEFVQQLSQVYRNVLEWREDKLVLLEYELEALRNYLFLLNIRFGEQLQIEQQISQSAHQCYIIPLSLQMLLENAVKHNAITKLRPLKIEICSKDNYIIVRNNLQEKRRVVSSTGFGLQNIQKRYELLVSDQVKIEKEQTHFSVALPLIQVETINA
ncbi:MAG: histidine kinase [Bacteroidota bacterium]